MMYESLFRYPRERKEGETRSIRWQRQDRTDSPEELCFVCMFVCFQGIRDQCLGGRATGSYDLSFYRQGVGEEI